MSFTIQISLRGLKPACSHNIPTINTITGFSLRQEKIWHKMSVAARSKRNRSRVGGSVTEGSSLQSRKEESVQLHDEADLVNFRTDAYARFVNNQEYLENVTLKLFHTSQISPPPSFPLHSKKKYPENALDEEVLKVLQEMKPEEIFMGDLRLMKAKLTLSLKELNEAEKVLEELSPKVVFSEKSLFQNDAINKLATLQQSCKDMESLEALEKAMVEILAQYKEKFSEKLEVQQLPYKQHSIAVAELAPEIEVKQAPNLYNPKLIMSFIDMNGERNNGDIAGQDFNEDESMLLETEKLAGQLPFMNNGIQGNDDFGMMIETGPKRGGAALSNQPDRAASAEYSEATPYNGHNYNGQTSNYNQADYARNYSKPSASGSGNASRALGSTSSLGAEGQGSVDEQDMNMDELNQFLAEPNDNEEMDDMDALMNFDQDNDNGEGLMDEVEFNVNFLSQMDNDM